MSFTDHKITQFAHRVADLPDEPQIPAAELKSRFDACPEELRVAHNAVCDDAARLEARVEGIVVDTFGDTIDKEMLSDELAAELDGKATQSALSAAIDAEAAARASADSALEQQIAQKCEIYCGTFTASGSNVTISLGFRPAAVLVYTYDHPSGITGVSEFGSLAIDGSRSRSVSITNDGFTVYSDGNLCLNRDYINPIRYIAFKPVG